jgi:integrase
MRKAKKKKIRTGSVFQRTYRDRQGRLVKSATWTIKYYIRGKPVQVPADTTDYQEALDMLRIRMGDIAKRGNHGDQPERVRMNQLFDLLVEHYRFKACETTYDTEHRIDKHLREFFGEMKAQALGSNARQRYIERRRRQKAKAATINKELAFLRRALKLGAKHDPPLVLHVPHIEMLPVDNVRKGTIEHEKYRVIRDLLPAHARIALVIAYHVALRKGAIRKIRREWVDLKKKRIELPFRAAENKGVPPFVPIYGDMVAELDMWLSMIKGSSCPFLIQDCGKAVFDYEKAWATACKAVGIPGTLFHDLRRTAISNMIEAGLSEKEAMEISGHKTRAVFDRYHIVSDRRMQQNAEKLEQYLKAKEASISLDTVTGSGDRQGGRPN